ncbi:MAG: hypothetical protein KatS3mg009_0450 [Acidimicrobiia bacterium]|nr:MAG: hypothetical protein KatS3mg009_0450 [Acidimicrobiia bacterium]
MIPYDQVLKELVLALGAALFLANAVALVRRRADAARVPERTVARHRAGSPVRGYGRPAGGELAQAPVARSVAYMLVGLVVAIWALASLVSG